MALDRRTYKVADVDGNTRLDRWCQRILGDAPNSVYQKAIRKGFVRLDGKKVEAIDKNGTTLYRTSVTGFASREAAKAFHQGLREGGETGADLDHGVARLGGNLLDDAGDDALVGQ